MKDKNSGALEKGALEKLGRLELEIEEFLEGSQSSDFESQVGHRGLPRRTEFAFLDKARIWVQANKIKLIGGFLGLLILIIGIRLLTSRGEGSGIEPESIPSLAGIAAAGETVERELKAHIVGAVLNPNVYEFKAGERVGDLIAKAGGSLAGANPNILNLAMPLTDGQKICVPFLVTEREAGICETHNIEEPERKVNINFADKEELESLPGIGPAFADSIIEYREANGGFRSLDDLANVSGITATVVDKFRSRAIA